MKLMELSIGLRESGMVKEALHKYRAMCMQSNVTSLEDVVRFLVDLAEKRTEDARKQVDETILEGAEDLEDNAMETPETLLLEAAGNALTKERIDRQQVVPWMRFLWEVYRVVLDIVKTHSKLEICYHSMAHRAFAFCVKYKRFTEFRRLCDMLRQHLSQLMNNPRVSPNDVKISDPDTLQKFMETRFTQLSTAVSLEHWQQAYRTIEDIHMIMTMGKAKAKPQHMSVYYDKLMQVFWVSGNYLYHAHALYKLYTLSIKQNRKLSADDAQNMASRLLLAALSIPVYDAQSAVLSDSYGILSDVLGTPTNENSSRHARMASLLGYSAAAERGPLIVELLSKGVRDAAHPELYDVYDLLEGEMAPLQFADRFNKILAFVETHETLKEYIVPLRRVGIFRLLEQLGRVYDVMRLEDMKRVASFTNYTEVEETALTALKTRSLAVRFDYQNQCLRFESELFSSDGMRKQLGRLARRMALTSKMLTEGARLAGLSADDSEVVASALEKERKATVRRQMAVAKARESAQHEAQNILRRRDIIERRKEEAERRTAEAVKQKKLAAARELALAEARRKKEEQIRMEQQKVPRPTVPFPGFVGSGTAIGSGLRPGLPGAEPIGATGATAEEVDAEREESLRREKETELREQAEFKKRVQQLSVHLNHMERALREEQWDKLKEQHLNDATEQTKQMEEIAAKELEDAKSQHNRALEDKGKTMQIMPHLKEYLSDLMSRVDADFEVWARKERERAEAQAAKEAELAKQLAEEEAKQRQQREAEAREREENEKREREAREAREAEEKKIKEAEEKRMEEEMQARKEAAERERKSAAATALSRSASTAAEKPPSSASAQFPSVMATGNRDADARQPPAAAGKYRPGAFTRARSAAGAGTGLGPGPGTASAGGPAGFRSASSMGGGIGGSAGQGESTRDSFASFGSTRPSSIGGNPSRPPSVSASRESSMSRDERPKSGSYVPPHLRNAGRGAGPGGFAARSQSTDGAGPPAVPGPRLQSGGGGRRPYSSSFGGERGGGSFGGGTGTSGNSFGAAGRGGAGRGGGFGGGSGGSFSSSRPASGGSDAPPSSFSSSTPPVRKRFFNSKLGQKAPGEEENKN